MPTGMATSSFMPMKYHETISVFVNKGKPTFNKQNHYFSIQKPLLNKEKQTFTLQNQCFS